jgi:acyl-ACP thioesterase
MASMAVVMAGPPGLESPSTVVRLGRCRVAGPVTHNVWMREASASPVSPVLPSVPGPGHEFRPEPPAGRVFTGTRPVRSTDVTPSGRFRLDALARYLQDVAEDDVAATGWQAPYGWLLRRCAVVIRGYPRFGERLRLRTFCSATGPRWAERTTTVAGPGGDLIQAVAVWVSADLATGQPCPLGEEFHRIYGQAAQGRSVSARLSLPGPESLPGHGETGPGRDWALRATDFDMAGHVNNSVHWAALEDVIAGLGWLPASAELEYHRPIKPACQPRLLTGPGSAPIDGLTGAPASGHAGGVTGSENGRGLHVWLLDGAQRLASGWLAR